MMVYTCATISNWLGEAAMPVRSPSRVNDGIGSDLNVILDIIKVTLYFGS